MDATKSQSTIENKFNRKKETHAWREIIERRPVENKSYIINKLLLISFLSALFESYLDEFVRLFVAETGTSSVSTLDEFKKRTRKKKVKIRKRRRRNCEDLL